MKFINITEQNYTEVAEIYRQGIATGTATFQNSVPSWEEWDSSHLAHSRIALFEADKMLGCGKILFLWKNAVRQ